jgi:ubiquinone/menaquinone biosynthesis C-methylase UbiE
MYFSGQNEPYDFSDILKLKGDEYVLDIGCGLGKASIGVAKQLDKRGRVIGIDIWDKLNIINNSPSNAYKNARLEGVQDKIEFKTGNALAIPFPSDTFDVVIAALILNSFWSNEKKERFLSEAYRVVRYGGRFLLIEHLRNLEMIILCPILALWKFLPKDVCDKLLKKIGFFNLEYSKKETMGYFLAKKPSSGKASNNKADFV